MALLSYDQPTDLSQSQMVIHSDDDLLIGAEITFGRLDRRGGHLNKRRFTYVSEQAASCFQWLTGFRNKQVRKLMHRNLSFSMLLKMEDY
jgi:hypothetical protein